jgi:hypothetical protein
MRESSITSLTNVKNFQGVKGRKGLRATSDIIWAYIEFIKSYIEDYSETLMFQEMVNQLLNYSFEKKRMFDLVAAMGMCEVLDKELRGVNVIQNVPQETFQSMSWYVDLNGVKKFGIKPKIYGFQ